jgi:hypothetical protein
MKKPKPKGERDRVRAAAEGADEPTRKETMSESSGSRADLLVEEIRRRGSDAVDLRDAAHEAHHALSAGVKGRWTRVNIAAAIKKKRRPGWASFDEVLARAVEQIVCATLDTPCPTVESCALTSSLEAWQFDRVHIDIVLFVTDVRFMVSDALGIVAANRVLRLAKLDEVSAEDLMRAIARSRESVRQPMERVR